MRLRRFALRDAGRSTVRVGSDGSDNRQAA